MTATAGQCPEAHAPETASFDLLVGSPTLITYQAAAWPAGLFTQADLLSDRGPQTDITVGKTVIPVPRGSLFIAEFFGLGSDNDADAYWMARKWHRIRQGVAQPTSGGSPQPAQWTCQVLGYGSYTLSGQVGVANGFPLATHRYADAIVVTADRTLASPGIRVMGPSSADDNKVQLVIDPLGPCLLEMILRRGNSGTPPTSLGFLYGGVGSG